ncbi:hypothetical protein [Sandaracinus amylolyticus]|uniref:Uncharacterized protein n=1 Tax=Sandaracinus amylolyticus TaxID=927083 RepID=A0A0F6WAR3_9BACT|nr:hypothetical protein [Sandaracinus amylolyticus]AKF11787.1 hypothetical protein DB32_008936 [Sandaracinus amylolyticus]
MGTAILLRGACRESGALDAIEAFATSRGGAFVPLASRAEDEDGRPLLALAIHPAAEPLRVIDVGRGRIVVEATTGTAGPGYHAHVAELLHAASDALGIAWDHVEDESGYFESRDRRALEDATKIWLATTAMEILSLHARGVRGVQLSLPEGTIFEHPGVLATPMGPRDVAWIERVARTPGDGIDVFPWWEHGETAKTLRDAAIAAMWIDVRWRPPILDAERALFERVLGWLDRGQTLAPDLEWPWREQSELLERLGEDSLRATRVHLRASALPPAAAIGYRRNPVRVTLSGGWSMRVPGELAERWEERGTWVAWDASRSVWFNSLEVEGTTSSDKTLAALPEIEGEGDLMGFDRGPLRAVARFADGEEDGQRLVQLHAHAALGAHAAFGTVVITKDDDREWALETWSSLVHVEER